MAHKCRWGLRLIIALKTQISVINGVIINFRGINYFWCANVSRSSPQFKSLLGNPVKAASCELRPGSMDLCKAPPLDWITWLRDTLLAQNNERWQQPLITKVMVCRYRLSLKIRSVIDHSSAGCLRKELFWIRPFNWSTVLHWRNTYFRRRNMM